MVQKPSMRTLGAIFYHDFELLDMYGPLEMFGNLGEALKIVTVAEQAGSVSSAQGPQTVAEYDFTNCPPLDLILIPGGIGTASQLTNSAMLEFLQSHVSNAEITMSVCSGSALLAKTGLLDGRKATSNKLFFEFATTQSDKVEWVEEARWVEDGSFFTSSGVSAGTDMALAVIAHLYGEEKAREISIFTEYDWQDNPTRDPFAQYLNQGALEQLLAAAGRT